MTPKAIATLAHELQGRSAATVDAELQHRHLDATTRLSVKLEIQAQAQKHINAMGEMAHDRAEYPTPTNPWPPEIARILTRAGVDLSRATGFTEAELDAVLIRAGVDDVVQRLGLKTELYNRGMIRQPQPAQEKRLYGKSMQASADGRPRGKVLRNADGTPRTLRGA
jgi:hypothetical protein